MEITNRLLGTSAIIKPDQRDAVGVDLNGIIRRLLLFDTYILKSLRLQEFQHLVQLLGFEATMQLLKSPAFHVQCECVTVAQTGQASVLAHRERKGSLPPLSYCISAVDAADHKKYVHDCLLHLHNIPGLDAKHVIKLKRAIADKLIRLPAGFAGSVSSQTTGNILTKPHLLRKSVQIAAQQISKIQINDFEMEAIALDSEDIRVETNLADKYGLDVGTVHTVVERGLLGIGGMTQRFAEMQAYSALSGFVGDDLPLVYEQLDFLGRALDPEAKERQFRRIVSLAGFPDFGPAVAERQVNIDRLLEIRESTECIEFRAWLSTLDSASDDDVKERVSSLRAKLGNAIQTGEGKAVRLLATTGIGLIPGVGLIAGAAAAAVDSFLLEKVLPKSGPIVFLSKLYPSVFEESIGRAPHSFLPLE